MHETEDLRIREIRPVASPGFIHDELPITEAAVATVLTTRRAIRNILQGKDDRLVVIAGPCSIHDPRSAREYAGKLLAKRTELAEHLLLLMRVYFEKPRTTVGWKGLINDPDLDGTFEINKGLRVARELLLHLNDKGLPAGVEFLDVVTPQYFMDLVSWGAIGARTTESQVHRELASGLSCPVGFKNGTEGNLRIAVDAVRAARHSHCFLSYTQSAQSAIFTTAGNEDTHVILRGGKEPNFDSRSVATATRMLVDAGLEDRIMIDFSHANSRKEHERQRDVCEDVCGQIAGGEQRILGVMIESHLVSGRQEVVSGQSLVYGQSITDACIDWETTIGLLDSLADAVAVRRHRAPTRAAS